MSCFWRPAGTVSTRRLVAKRRLYKPLALLMPWYAKKIVIFQSVKPDEGVVSNLKDGTLDDLGACLGR